MSTIAVDLGCGPSPKNPFSADNVIGIDLINFGSGIVECELGFEPIPLPDSSADFVTAFDVLEHIPRSGGNKPNRNPFIYLMNEVWRILKPNGRFFAQTPTYPNPNAFSDPTHVNLITSETIRYFATEITGDGHRLQDDRIQLGKRYGFAGRFDALRNYATPAYGHQIWLLQALK